jgi:hypothetical protein
VLALALRQHLWRAIGLSTDLEVETAADYRERENVSTWHLVHGGTHIATAVYYRSIF